MNCWIIWWTGNSKFKISSLIRQMKLKKSYLLEFLFYFWCCVLCYYQLLSWTAVNFAFRMLECCLDLLKFPYIYFILCIDQLEASVPPPEEFLEHLNFWRLVCSNAHPSPGPKLCSRHRQQSKTHELQGGCWSLLAYYKQAKG